MMAIRRDKRICFSCTYHLLYRLFGKNPKVGLQWLAHVWRMGKSRQIIVEIAKKINSFA